MTYKEMQEKILSLWNKKYGNGETKAVIEVGQGEWYAWVYQDDKHSPEGSIGQIAYGKNQKEALQNLLGILEGRK